jgi:hypothetical protein
MCIASNTKQTRHEIEVYEMNVCEWPEQQHMPSKVSWCGHCWLRDRRFAATHLLIATYHQLCLEDLTYVKSLVVLRRNTPRCCCFVSSSVSLIGFVKYVSITLIVVVLARLSIFTSLTQYWPSSSYNSLKPGKLTYCPNTCWLTIVQGAKHCNAVLYVLLTVLGGTESLCCASTSLKLRRMSSLPALVHSQNMIFTTHIHYEGQVFADGV